MYQICIVFAIASTIMFLFSLGAICYGLPFWWLFAASVCVGAVDAFILYGYKGRKDE